MDKGFKRWFAGVAIARIRAEETAVLKDERAKRFLEEEQIRTRCRRCGWTALSWFLKGWFIVSFILGTALALFVLLSSIIIMVGTFSFISCAWMPPADQCMRIELVNRTSDEIIWSNEDICKHIDFISLWQKSIHIAVDEMFDDNSLKRYLKSTEARVCSLLAGQTGLGNWERLAGIYKFA